LIVQLTESIRELDVETRSCDAETKKSYQLKVTELRKAVNEHQSNYRRIKVNSERNGLLEGRSKVDQERYLNTNEKFLLSQLFP
jgi:hypothetical protein